MKSLTARRIKALRVTNKNGEILGKVIRLNLVDQKWIATTELNKRGYNLITDAFKNIPISYETRG